MSTSRPTFHSRFPRCGRRGFTLLELLVSITILALISAIVYSIFFGVTETMAETRDSADQLQYRQLLERHLSVNLASVYADAACLREEYVLEGANKDGNLGGADELRFCTSLPMPGARSLPGVLKVVQYRLVPEDEIDAAATGYPGSAEGRPAMALMISETPLTYSEGIDGSLSGSDQLPVSERAIPVASFDVQYYDGLSDEWREDWNSLDERRLPWAVWVRVNFPRSDAEQSELAKNGVNLQDSPDLDVMVALPAGAGSEGPFMDFNRARMTDTETMDNAAQTPK